MLHFKGGLSWCYDEQHSDPAMLRREQILESMSGTKMTPDSRQHLPGPREAALACPAARSGGVPFVTIDDFLWFLYLYPLRVLAALVPQNFLYSIGRLFQFRARKRRETTVRRMVAAGCSYIVRDRMPQVAREFLVNSTIRMLDDLVLDSPAFLRKLRCVGIEGREHLERGRSTGRGVILLTAHFCATRVAKRYLETLGYPILTVRDEFSQGEWWGRCGRRLLAARRIGFLHAIGGESACIQDPGCTLKIFSKLRSGGLVHIHLDGRSAARKIQWPFLGAPRHFSAGIFDLVRLSGCAVVPMLCLGRIPALRISFSPTLEIVDVPGRDEFIRANLPTFVGTIEKQIAEHPEEWEQWMSI